MGLLELAWSGLLDALAPTGCLACDTACPPGEAFCSSCGCPARLGASPTLDGLKVAVIGAYEPPLSTAIVRFKYQGRAELARELSRLLLPQLAWLDAPADAAFVPVPLHPRRLAARGYNQAALLAGQLARRAERAYEPRLLARTRETERQVGKSRQERLENADHAFVLRRSGPASVVLVDDVVTTGSTVRACAHALARGGVALVGIAALARAEHG